MAEITEETAREIEMLVLGSDPDNPTVATPWGKPGAPKKRAAAFAGAWKKDRLPKMIPVVLDDTAPFALVASNTKDDADDLYRRSKIYSPVYGTICFDALSAMRTIKLYLNAKIGLFSGEFEILKYVNMALGLVRQSTAFSPAAGRPPTAPWKPRPSVGVESATREYGFSVTDEYEASFCNDKEISVVTPKDPYTFLVVLSTVIDIVRNKSDIGHPNINILCPAKKPRDFVRDTSREKLAGEKGDFKTLFYICNVLDYHGTVSITYGIDGDATADKLVETHLKPGIEASPHITHRELYFMY